MVERITSNDEVRGSIPRGGNFFFSFVFVSFRDLGGLCSCMCGSVCMAEKNWVGHVLIRV